MPSNRSPENRSGLAEKTASFALGYEPRLRPDQFDSPGIAAGQQIVSPKKWGIVQAFCAA
jgi:hypothetical protein